MHDNHWKIEQYDRAIKQICHIERFQVRNECLIKIIFLRHYVVFYTYKKKMRAEEIISNFYQYRRSYNDVVAFFITNFRPKNFLGTYYYKWLVNS